MRTTTGRCLLLLVALCVTAQASALAVHAPFEVAAEAQSDEERGGDHVPDSCDLCQLLSQVRVQVTPPALQVVALVAFAQDALASALGLVAAGPTLSASVPRAPPAGPIS
ncbi:MAG: hypothetical protein ACQGVC_01935 [Myxococcota bacterium]